MQPEITAQVLDLQDIAAKTMFLSLEFNSFGNSKKADLEVKTDASQERFTHSKRLLNSPELKSIKKADMALKIWLDQPTRCWKYSKGMRLIPHGSVKEVLAACKQYEKSVRPALVKDFLATYLSHVSDAQQELNSQFNPKDYPSVEQVEQDFEFKFQLLSFTTPDNLKALDPELFEEEKEKAHQYFMSAAEDAKTGMRVALQEMVNHLLDILTPDADGKKKRLHGSTVEKLQAFLNAENMFKTIGDTELQAEVAKLKSLLDGVNVGQIKESDNLQADIVAKFKEVSGTMEHLVQKSGRKFR